MVFIRVFPDKGQGKVTAVSASFMASDNGMAINSLIRFSSILNDNDMEVFFGNSTEKFAGKMKSISGAPGLSVSEILYEKDGRR